MDLDKAIGILPNSGPVFWGIGLVVGFPLLFIILSELIHQFDRLGHPIASTLRNIRNLLLPTLALQVLLAQVVELDPAGLTMKIVYTVAWIFVIHTGLSLIKDVVFASAAAGSWQARVPKLLLDLARTILVLIGGAIVLSTVWEANLTNLAAALGVGSIVIGLALQEPMGNVFAGMALLFERPLALGDWITVEGTTGKVIEINWRSVHIKTSSRDVRIVPNSSLYKGSFSNLSRPDTRRTEVVELGFSHDDPPNKVKEVILETLAGTAGVLVDPAPVVRTFAYGDFSINYRVLFSVASQDAVPAVRDDFMTRFWYAASRHGLNVAYRIQTQNAFDQQHKIKTEELLRSFPQFAAKDASEKSQVSSRAVLKKYAGGERVISEGDHLQGLHLILKGHAALSVRDRCGIDQEIARAGKGEYFGEQAIVSSQSSDISVTALEDLEVLVLDPETLNVLIDELPRLAREIGGLMDIRRKAAQSARKLGAPAR